MEIDFSPSRLPKAELGQSSAQQGAVTPVSPTVMSFPTADSLKLELNELPIVRTEQVSQAKDLMAVTHYPPLELLERIAVLLAVHLK